MTCKTCQQLVHNKRTCLDKDKPSSSASPTKRRRGRPRKEMVDPLQESEPTAAPQRTRATMGRPREKWRGRGKGRGGRAATLDNRHGRVWFYSLFNKFCLPLSKFAFIF